MYREIATEFHRRFGRRVDELPDRPKRFSAKPSISDGGHSSDDTQHPLVGDVFRCVKWDETFFQDRLHDYDGDCPWCGEPVKAESEDFGGSK